MNWSISKKEKSVRGSICILSFILIAMLIVGAYIFKDKVYADNNIQNCQLDIKRDSNIYLNNGEYVIERNMIENEKPMGTKDVWTIFIYMCGSDYETKNGAASKDIEEMLDASMNNNIRIVLQTGGSKKWHNSNIDSNKMQRFLIHNGKMELMDESNMKDSSGKLRNMGNPDELYSFLTWGITHYASENMGVILWNHGGGSSDGICYDEYNDMDSLKIAEVELALCNTRKIMTSRFEFIGFDACVMQNIEMANLMVPYAKYMVGSETAELEKGFDYKGVIEYISKHNNASTLDICKKICDYSYEAYLKSITGFISSGSVVFSVIDLQKVDNFLYEFNKVAKALNDSIYGEQYYKILKSIENSTRFGAGQIDIYDMLCNIENDIVEAKSVKNTVLDMISYSRKSNVVSWYNNANGLSMFVCSNSAQLQNYNNLINVAISPYIMNYYESIIYGESYGNLDKYKNNKTNWENISNYYCKDFSFIENIFENEKEFIKNYANNNDKNSNIINKWRSVLKNNVGINILDDTSNIICEKSISLNEDNSYSMKISTTSISKVSDVKVKIFSRVYNELEGDYVYRELGVSNMIDFNKENGEIVEKINGNWLQLPNGVPLAVTDIYKSNNYERLISPCYINDEYVYLYSTLNLNNNSVEIEGYADTYENDSIQTKMLNKLKEGDCIQPMFLYTKNVENGAILKDDEMNYGFCNVDKDFALEYSKLGEDVYFSIILEDVFGTEIYTPIEKK